LENKNKDILTPQDALLTVGLCTASINVNNAYDYLQRITNLARFHSLFSDQLDAITQKIEGLVPLLQCTDPATTISLAAKPLTPELRETAFK
jgi:hypothetical protein